METEKYAEPMNFMHSQVTILRTVFNLKFRVQCSFRQTATNEEKISMQRLETILELCPVFLMASNSFVYFTADLDELSRQSDLCESESLQ